MLRTKTQNARLHMLLGRLALDKETKEELVHQHTGGRSMSTKDLTISECDALIGYLKTLPGANDPIVDTSVTKQRGKIISICYEMRWTLAHDPEQLDWTRINSWMLKSSYLKKYLNNYKRDELPALVTQFEQVLKSFYAKR